VVATLLCRCCSFSNGEYVKTGLAQVESWIMEHGTEWVGESWEELKFIRQAVTFLVIGNKPKKTLEDITKDLCPVLSIQQLYRISTMYWDDKYNTETVSSEVRAERELDAELDAFPFASSMTHLHHAAMLHVFLNLLKLGGVKQAMIEHSPCVLRA
jgi:hypothetical protein